jgi:hypothetical protein
MHKQVHLRIYYQTWLGLYNLFQTFEDLESVKDKQSDIQAVRQLLDETDGTSKETQSC